MRTLRHAAELLGGAHVVAGQLSLAAALGFDGVALNVDRDGCRRLGLPEEIAEAHVVRGAGALRALILTTPAEPSLRELFTRAAGALRANTAHVLWMLIATAANGSEVGVACWPDERNARLLTLVGNRERIAASDAEALCALAAAADGGDLLVHTRWCELLGREALSRRFYRRLEQRVRALADSLTNMNAEDRATLALLYVSRLLFLSYLEAKGWLDGDYGFLVRRFDACMARGGRFHQRVLLPLFFGTLNTPMRNRASTALRFGAVPFLNGGLFAKGAFERRHSSARFSDQALGALFGELLSAYRFTAREGEQGWSDLSIDPEMLGRAFESLMAARDRRTSGAFYTPQALVAHLAERALVTALGEELTEDDVRSALGGHPMSQPSATVLRRRLRSFTVLDPACGSGAFLVHMLERLSVLHRAAGDPRGMASIRREVLARAIHGVDINPTAVWLCELRLWLSVVIESDETRMAAVPPLPNLDCNVRVGDSLSGEAFTEPPSLVGPSAALVRLRERYVRAAGPSKTPLRRLLASEERRRALAAIDREFAALQHARLERIAAQRSSDLFGVSSRPGAEERAEMRTRRLRAAALRRERRRIENNGALPFSFPSHFGAAHGRGGFDLVIGNPPWVRLHNIPPAARATLRSRYSVFRNAAWEPEVSSGRAARGFSAQVDLASLFVERSIALASPHGCVALLLPAKLWRSLAGGGVRALLATRAELRVVEDWSEAPSSFDAAVYPSIVIASTGPARGAPICAGVRRRSLDVRWPVSARSLRLIADDAASPWLLLPPPARVAFDAMASHGVALSHAVFGRVTLGVKCGCNDAFLVNAVGEESGAVRVEQQGRRGVIERELIRPLLRGEGLTPWSIAPTRGAIVWTHAEPGTPLRALPPGAARWLNPWRRQLLNRTDLHGTATWWMLFRTESADPSRTRVVWSDFGRVPRAAVLPAGDLTVPLNSCYVVACDDVVDALALTALLNSPLAAAWINAVAEPARGGWHRYLAWTVSLLPIPRDWTRARSILAPLAEAALVGRPPAQAALFSATCRAFRLRPSTVEPLVSWCHSQTQS